MILSERTWNNYIRRLSALSNQAAAQLRRYVERKGGLSMIDGQELVTYAYGLATRYGEGATALAAEMYDAVAALSRTAVPAAVPAATATYDEVAKAIYGTLKTGNLTIVSDAVGRQVKMAGVDTTMHNAIRDGAEWAWIPMGDTCAFCIALASRGWQEASREALNGNHAEHIHANCDCTYAVRWDRRSTVSGYAPERYKRMYDEADGRNSTAKINSLRREFYAENNEEINAQKRDAYAKRQERESSEAEELNV